MHRRHLMKSALAASVLLPAGRALAALGEETKDPFQRAFFYAFPLYEQARIEQERTGAVGQPGKLNVISHRSQLMDHNSHQVTAPNNDTIYSSIFLELSGGPVELAVPSSTDRYFSLAFMSAFTDVFAYVGTRATKGQGGRFWIVGPNWKGAAPAGVGLIRAPSNDVWALMRVLVDGPADLAAARAFQGGLTLSVPTDRPPPRAFAAAAVDVNDPVRFLALVNEVIARSPGGGGQFHRARQFAAQGIGTPGLPSRAVLDQWRATIPGALEVLRETFRFRDYAVGGWSYQPPGIGDFGTNDQLRAAVALGGIAALGEEEAMYFHANFDAAGQPLMGQTPYRWRVPPGGVPVDAFWSLTMYEVTPEGRYFFTDNPIGRYAIGDRTPGLIKDADGAFEILIQRERPVGAMAANWLPAPSGRMRLALRAYLPRRELRTRSWRVPALTRT
ncbi:DUF1254 domain-containing protein [Caulobacter segnis]|uniref:DUF1254 domain-containing protein n=1 Tax=Caulobacter segnis TaxID=88688 RepID=A0A2W5V973_9CAUL|nr:DUF1254 domain-containing protein [Caulobacter segnis]PZR33246.1 MAG: DUF1254 domain-containing protein [Caulobacter segnis]